MSENMPIVERFPSKCNELDEGRTGNFFYMILVAAILLF